MPVAHTYLTVGYDKLPGPTQEGIVKVPYELTKSDKT